MDKLPSHRLRIWGLGNKDRSEPIRPASTQGERRPERFTRQDLLYADLGSPAPFTRLDEPTMLTSLYDHRLPIDVELPGRCTMPNGRSTTCKTKTISSESVELVYDLQTAGYPIKPPEEIPPGSTIHLDVDQIGNFHGTVTSQNSEGFQLAVDVNCKGMLISKLSRIAASMRGSRFVTPAATAHTNITRIEPTIKTCSFTDNTGTVRRGKIINISQIDALIKAPVIPPVGSQIVFSGRPTHAAEVTRSFEIGFAVKFCPPIPVEQFSAAIRLLDE